MSTLNTTNIKHAGNTGDANIVLASNGNVTVNGDISADNITRFIARIEALEARLTQLEGGSN